MAFEWPKPWRAVDERWQAYIAGELSWELSHFPDHPLSGRSFTVVAMMDLYDNAIILLDGGGFGYIHLPGKADSPPCEPIGGEECLASFLRGGTAAAGGT